MEQILKSTRSVCPVCLRQLPAVLARRQGAVYMDKTCPEHGAFSTPIWRDQIDLTHWQGAITSLAEEGPDCSACSGLCPSHQQGSCCVLLEVTRRCDLRCRFCFAAGERPEPSLTQLKQALAYIYSPGRRPTLQLSGGEPALRDDLPALVAMAKEAGAPYVQLNSNGLRLAEDEPFVQALADAGLSFVFMQFDGVDNGVYQQLRNAPLLKQKLRAIELCDKYNIGVTLVPTVVRGVNDRQIGDIISLAASLSPAVRGVHFQPVSYFGRCPGLPEASDRYTLDELVQAISLQAHISPEHILPSRCDHPLCGCHGSFLVLPGGQLKPLSQRREEGACCPATAERNRDYIASRWQRPEPASCCCGPEEADISTLEGFLSRAKSHGFTITAMAFQDAGNLDYQRLRQCSLHVYCPDEKGAGVLKPFCAAYLTPWGEQL